jgi:hypothetical protein
MEFHHCQQPTILSIKDLSQEFFRLIIHISGPDIEDKKYLKE